MKILSSFVSFAKSIAKFINNNSTIDKHITIKGIMYIYKNLVK